MKFCLTGNKDSFEEVEHLFPSGIFLPENRATFSDALLLQEMFRWTDPKSRVPFTFQPDFQNTFCK